MFSTSASQKGLQLICEWQDTVPRFINADEKKIRQILINVLGNAVKFTRIGGIAFRVKTAGSIESPVLKAEIEDSGPGISPEDAQHMFESFQQSQEGRDLGGTGLGLAITKQLLDMMGGSITVESVVGAGSVFRIEIPVRIAEKAAEAAELAPEEDLWRLREGSPPVRILVSDDIDDNRILLRTLLESAGFDVREARDGIETIAVVREWKPHALLLDLRMPRMDGYEAARKISEDPATAQLPMIAVTASAFEEDKKTVMAAGFSGYVRRPFKPQEIFAILRSKLNLDFEPVPPASEEGNSAEPIGPQDMQRLDAETKESLREALERGNIRQFRTMLEKVALTEPELAASLSELARTYNYDRLGELLRSPMTNGRIS
jgi:CheY-like chemotaxis protein/anti-sigma regulatory factor (Ser/Thr protein kinase)